MGKKEKTFITKIHLIESSLTDYELLAIHVNSLTENTRNMEKNVQNNLAKHI